MNRFHVPWRSSEVLRPPRPRRAGQDRCSSSWSVRCGCGAWRPWRCGCEKTRGSSERWSLAGPSIFKNTKMRVAGDVYFTRRTLPPRGTPPRHGGQLIQIVETPVGAGEKRRYPEPFSGQDGQKNTLDRQKTGLFGPDSGPKQPRYGSQGTVIPGPRHPPTSTTASDNRRRALPLRPVYQHVKALWRFHPARLGRSLFLPGDAATCCDGAAFRRSCCNRAASCCQRYVAML